MILKETFTLHNGVKIPKVGYGTWQITDEEQCVNGVKWALDAGYIHIDTAAAYQNEQFIRRALQEANVKREDLFITSKLHAAKKGFDVAIEEFNKTLERLGTTYLDLYLIHAPKPWGDTSDKDWMPDNIETWKALEQLYREGRIRSIGVSNFSVDQLKQLMAATTIKPMVNQIRIFIGSPNRKLKEFCEKENILVEAYSPLATSRIFNNEEVVKMAQKYGVTAAQLSIKWCLDYQTLPLPKSTHQKWIVENSKLDFKISKEDFEYLLSL
ncbi:MAG: aldo/keto reductase [Bacilli bacterium]|jgi:diketogulonate reductase-like aldo/keto reductase|nr:aldo/keto reductase [Bacilli bacterium]MDY0064590.1 aldo/keto reductase [Bacilli bacterium]